METKYKPSNQISVNRNPQIPDTCNAFISNPQNPKTLEISNSFITITIKLSKQNTNSQLKSVSTETPKFPKPPNSRQL
jgi:hypothetical protein